MGQRAKWNLPTTVNPTGTRCFRVEVPDEDHYIMAFRGALYEMAKAYAWGNDPEHTALDVAARCLEMWEGIEEISCEMPAPQFRQSGTNCQYEISIDGGTTWVAMPDYSDCAYAGGLQAIADKIEDGTLGARGQQPPGGVMSPGECHTYHVALSGRDIWHCPVPIRTGATVQVTNASGGWYDGGELIWRCPGGDTYFLGQCNPGEKTTQPTDPLPTAYHMQIVAHYNSAWFNPMSGIYTIPAGVDYAELFLQANDSDITNNKGGVEFDIQVCSGGWCYEWDKAHLNEWLPWISGGRTYASYNAAYGITANYFDQITAYAPASATWYHLEFEMTVNETLGSPNHRDIARGTANNPTNTVKTEALVHGVNQVMSWDGNAVTGVPFVSMYNGGNGLSTSYISRIRIFGTDAVCPYGTPNCG